MIKVSVCSITYNHRGLIKDALDGFMHQRTDFPYEVIVHDDASTDGTADVLREYAARHDNVRLILRKENIFSHTRIYPVVDAIAEARGKYIALCDGDDYWTDPEKLQKQADCLDANPGYVLCYHRVRHEWADGRVIRYKMEPPHDYTAEDLVNFDRRAWTKWEGKDVEKNMIHASTLMCRNLYPGREEAWRRYCHFDVLILRYLGRFGAGKYLPEIAPSVWRKHPGNSWSGKTWWVGDYQRHIRRMALELGGA